MKIRISAGLLALSIILIIVGRGAGFGALAALGQAIFFALLIAGAVLFVRWVLRG